MPHGTARFVLRSFYRLVISYDRVHPSLMETGLALPVPVTDSEEVTESVAGKKPSDKRKSRKFFTTWRRLRRRNGKKIFWILNAKVFRIFRLSRAAEGLCGDGGIKKVDRGDV